MLVTYGVTVFIPPGSLFKTDEGLRVALIFSILRKLPPNISPQFIPSKYFPLVILIVALFLTDQ